MMAHTAAVTFIITNHLICRNMMEKATKASIGSYSTMSLPRRMPVKKLVSAFNARAHIERQGSTPPATTAAPAVTMTTVPPPTYSTLQRRIRSKVAFCRIIANFMNLYNLISSEWKGFKILL